MNSQAYPWKTQSLKSEHDYLAPDQSEIRLLPNMKGGGLAHCLLPASQCSQAVRHQTVEEIWYVLEGRGELWRKVREQEEIVPLRVGMSVTLPVHTSFQFRNTGSKPLEILIATMPPWPGPQEAVKVKGRWDVLLPESAKTSLSKERV